MRRAAVALAATALLAACDAEQQLIEPNRDQMDAVVTYQPFTGSFENPCMPGTLVTMSGTLKVTSDFFFDESGAAHNRLQVRIVEATALDTGGNLYDVDGGVSSILYFGDAAITTTETNVLRLRPASGGGTAMVVQNVTHATFVDGVPKATFVHENASCTAN